jgi:hypothetical protein
MKIIGDEKSRNTVPLIQKYHQKIAQCNDTKFSQLIGELLCREGRPDLQEHVIKMGPVQWMKTCAKLRNVNLMLEASKSVAQLLTKYEDSVEDWHQYMGTFSHA